MKKSPSAAFLIRDMETLRVISEPTRAQVFDILAGEPQTVRQVAQKMGLAASKLYYHFNLLEKHGLIQVHETRQVANLIEKVYRAVAAEIDVDPEIFSSQSGDRNENLMAIVRATIDATREDLIRSLQARFLALEQDSPKKERHLVISRNQAYISDEQAEYFRQKVHDLLKELEQADLGAHSGREDVQLYALMAAYYPNFYFGETETASSVKDDE
ncbi:MAG: helix-turn-helix domain-containing protein [Chloroflexota bacterium]